MQARQAASTIPFALLLALRGHARWAAQVSVCLGANVGEGGATFCRPAPSLIVIPLRVYAVTLSTRLSPHLAGVWGGVCALVRSFRNHRLGSFGGRVRSITSPPSGLSGALRLLLAGLVFAFFVVPPYWLSCVFFFFLEKGLVYSQSEQAR